MKVFNLEEAGLEWLNNPAEAICRADNEWDHALAFVTSWDITLLIQYGLAMEAEDELEAKKCQQMLLRIEKTGSFIQSKINVSKRH